MRVAVLGEPDGWHVGSLAAALRHRGHAATIVRWAELGATAGGGADSFAPPAVAEADAIVVRGMPGIAAAADRLEGVIFRMDVLARLAARGTPVVNPPRALELAIDKYLSLSILSAAGIDVPHTTAVQNAADAERAWRGWGGDCVAKPIFGSRGRGIVRITTPAAAAEAVAAGNGVAYLQEFVRHPGWDARILVVGDRVFAMRRIARAGDWRTNVSLGGRPEPFSPPAPWLDLARGAAAALGATVAGVDLLPAEDGRLLVLEVNAVPGWRGLQTVVDADCAAEIAAHLEQAARARLG
jgi:RimK family alpha-L-glutamate ligase